jgi:hypothetical protein
MKNIYIVILLVFNSIVMLSQGFSPENIIPKPKLAYPKTTSSLFSINGMTAIVLNQEKPDFSAAYFLNKKLSEKYIDTLRIFVGSYPDTFVHLIYLGVCDKILNDFIQAGNDQPVTVDKDFPGPEGYIIDVTYSKIIVNGSDSDGLKYGILTLMQTLMPGDVTTFVMQYRIIDFPDYPVRWIYYPMNFLVDQNTTNAKKKWSQWADWKINGINVSDYKFDFISTQPKKYLDSLSSAAKFAKANNLKFIPGTMSWGYSNGMMFFNPNFATGLHVNSQKFYIESDTAKVVPTVNVTMPNGDFETYNGNKFSGFLFIDGEGTKSFVDNTVVKSGKASIRFENFDGSNFRVCYRTKVSPFKSYHISGWIKTENVSPSGDIRLTVLNNKNQTLNYANLNVPATTNGWKNIDVMVNSLLGDTITVYWGIWGGQSGKIWWDNLKVEEAAFVNLLRRDGTPLNVDNPLKDNLIREGIDFDTLVDKKLGAAAGWLGEYDTYHQPPTFKIKKDGSIKNGDSLYISYSHAITVYDGQIMATFSEPKLYEQVENQFRILDSVVKPEIYFLNHDEIRVMNWDNGDLNRNMKPKELLADNVQKSIDIVHKFNPKADVWDWSDMFDNFHNAVNNYYLVNGDLTDVADLMSNSTGIVNWNSQANLNKKSLDFFSGKGFRQISAPYYDTDQNDIRIWKERSKDVLNFKGMMYTTWSGNYNYVQHFAEYGWNHAPYLYHTPLNVLPQKKLSFYVTIKGDDMDAGWKLSTAKLYYRINSNDAFSTEDLTINDNIIELNLADGNPYLEYYIEATDNHGWKKRNPLQENTYYKLGTLTDVKEINDKNNQLNPVIINNIMEIDLNGNLTNNIKLIDILGRDICDLVQIKNSSDKLYVDISNLKSGVYFINIDNRIGKFVKI